MSTILSSKLFSKMLLFLGIGVMLSACSFAPDYEQPKMDIPEAWTKLTPATQPLNTDWWKRFNDPVLNAMVDEALKNNQDLAASMAGIRQAAAQANIGSSSLWPSVSASGSATATGVSEKQANSSFGANMPSSKWFTAYQGQLAASWELDFWGATRNHYTRLTNIMLQTALKHEALRLSIAGQVCQSYFAMLSYDMQLATAKRTLATREEALRIYTSRYKLGELTELDWQRAKAEVETARASVHNNTMALDNCEASLQVLLGRSPREIWKSPERGAAIDKLPNPPAIPEGLPSELLLRRPDIRAAEFGIMASNAGIGEARAQFFPSFSITGALGTLAAGFGNLFTPASGTWGYGASVGLPIFSGGALWYNLKNAEALKEEAIATYKSTVMSAFSDVRTSLTAQKESDNVVKAMQAQVDSLRKAASIARLQYDNGYTDYLTVLDAERQLFTAELSLASALQNRLNSIVSVCMALGGGWEDPNVRPSFPVINADDVVAAQRKGTVGVRAEKAAERAAKQ